MTQEGAEIPSYFSLFLSLFYDAPGFKDNPRGKEILEFSASLDKIFEDLEDALAPNGGAHKS